MNVNLVVNAVLAYADLCNAPRIAALFQRNGYVDQMV